jgi:hypothetical protein
MSMTPEPAEEQLRRMRAAFHINMLRAFPGKTHAEIEAEIDKACGTAPQAASQQAGQWVHCTPDLINAGVSCAHTPRRAGDGTYSHDHWISHAPQAASRQAAEWGKCQLYLGAPQAATTASADNAEFLSTLQGAAKEATDEWIAGFVRQHFGIYAATQQAGALDLYMEASIALDAATDNFYGQAATMASAPARTQAGRDFDVEQAARAIESCGDYELANRLRHAWKVQCVATTASADQARDLLRTLINERYESQAQAARTWRMLPQVLNDMLQGRRALSDFVLAKLGLRPVVMYEKDE